MIKVTKLTRDFKIIYDQTELAFVYPLIDICAFTITIEFRPEGN